jgi:hypothetical protein
VHLVMTVRARHGRSSAALPAISDVPVK